MSTSQTPRPAELAPAKSTTWVTHADFARRLRASSHTLGILVALIALGFAFTLMNSRFLSLSNIGSILSQSTLQGIMAVGMTFAIVSGEIDLSVGSNFAVSGMVFGLALQSGDAMSLAIALAIATGGGLGLLNGILSVFFDISTIVITIGTLSAYAGVALLLGNGLPISSFSDHSVLFHFASSFLPAPSWLPSIFIVWLVVAALGHFALNNSTFGHRVCAVGSNRRAALDAGISPGLVRVQALTLVGLSAGVAAVIGVAQVQSADPSAGTTYNLSVIAAVIIGGASIYGGRGSMLATALGALLIGMLSNGLIVAGVNIYGQTIAEGALVVAAVTIDSVVNGETWYVRRLVGRLRSVSVRWPRQRLPRGAGTHMRQK